MQEVVGLLNANMFVYPSFFFSCYSNITTFLIKGATMASDIQYCKCQKVIQEYQSVKEIQGITLIPIYDRLMFPDSG